MLHKIHEKQKYKAMCNFYSLKEIALDNSFENRKIEETKKRKNKLLSFHLCITL